MIKQSTRYVSTSTNKLRVGVLGATGVVGQRFMELLENHPYFTLVKVGASERSAGKPYHKAATWRGQRNIPPILDDFVHPVSPENFADVDLVFSGLHNSIAGGVEEAFAAANIPVFSNAGNHRANPNVPCCAIMANSEHIKQMISKQQEKYKWTRGFIVTNPNCTTTGTVTALAPLFRRFGLKRVFATSMQAVSGAGYPGVSSMDVIDNLIPFINGEEEKMQWESNKILGTVQSDGTVKYADVKFSAHCNRVGVTDGHTVCVSVELGASASLEEVREAIAGYAPPELYKFKADMPSLPEKVLRIREEPNRPQPRFDRWEGGGYTTCVGRVRPCPLFDYKFTLTSHNTIIGAAGGSLLNAEYARAVGLLDRKASL